MPCPFNWEHASLGDIIDLRTGPFGSALHRSDYAFGEVPLINPMHITAGRIAANPDHCVSEDTAKRLSEYRLLEGDIVMGRRGEMGRCAVVGPPYVGSVCGTGSLILRRTDGIYSPFLQYFLSSDQVVSYLQSAAVGSTMANLNQKLLLGISIDIPPTTEQVRIVEKLEELLSDLDAGVAELKAAQKKLALYRQSLLKAAVEGALTADWRARRAARGEPLETGATLLARILTERRARWEARQLAKFKEQGKTPPKGWQAKYPEPVQPDTTNLSSLPAGWIWASLDMLGEIVSGVAKGSKQTPGISLREVPYLRVANVQRGFLDLSEIKKIMASERDIEELTLLNGDVLFNEGGDRDKLGRGWVWRDEVAQCIHQNHVFRMRPYLPEVLSEFVSHHGNTFGKSWFQQAGKQTTNLASINMGILRAFPVPVPPADEAREILERVSQEIDAIKLQEASIERGLRQATAQRKNLLKAAFSGQLVPQDPNDEPASALLARIRAERAAKGHNTRRQRPEQENS